jgi:hypothetical protein
MCCGLVGAVPFDTPLAPPPCQDTVCVVGLWVRYCLTLLLLLLLVSPVEWRRTVKTFVEGFSLSLSSPLSPNTHLLHAAEKGKNILNRSNGPNIRVRR